MNRPDEVTEYLRCGGMNCDSICTGQLDRLGVEDCLTWRVHGYVQQLEERVAHLDALNQQNLSVITTQERTRARLEEQISQLESCVPRWISVEERLPEPLTDVVVIVRHGDGWQYTIGYVLNEEWHRTGGSRNFYYGGKITHWLPLPPMPKEETT